MLRFGPHAIIGLAGIVGTLSACAAVLGLTDPELDEGGAIGGDDASTGVDARNETGSISIGDGGLDGASDDASDDAGADAAACMRVCDGGSVDTCSDKDNCGACGRVCDRGCVASACRAFTVFTTSVTFTGVLGGLTGGNAKCESRATAAGLKGAYKMFGASGTTTPDMRLALSAVPYENTLGERVAANFAALASGSLDLPMNHDETGKLITTVEDAWTGTSTTFKVGFTCGAWSIGDPGFDGSVGSTKSKTKSWFNSDAPQCSTSHRLYCFEQ
jgi:hypothetical protein